jgi:hypothetical protein
MRVKELVTSRMVGKKGVSKGKWKESKPVATTGDGLRKSKCSNADLKALVDEGLLQSQEIMHSFHVLDPFRSILCALVF